MKDVGLAPTSGHGGRRPTGVHTEVAIAAVALVAARRDSHARVLSATVWRCRGLPRSRSSAVLDTGLAELSEVLADGLLPDFVVIGRGWPVFVCRNNARASCAGVRHLYALPNAVRSGASDHSSAPDGEGGGENGAVT